MTEEPQTAHSAKPIPRIRIALNAFLQFFLLLFIFVIVNYLSCRHHSRWDLTLNQKFTLSSTTTGFLQSLDQDVEIIVAFFSGSDVSDDIKGLISEYERAGAPRIKVDYIDPGRNWSRATDLKNKYNLSLEQNAVIIATGDRVKVVSEETMFTRNQGGIGRVTEFRGESALTSALIEAVQKEKKKLYLVTGQRPILELQILMKIVHDHVTTQNAEIHEFFFPNSDSVPEDCDALVLIGPQVDLSPREIEILTAYWENDKGSIILLLDPTAGTPNLHAFLRAQGIVPQDDRVLLAASVPGLDIEKTYTVPAVFLPGSPVTRELMGVHTTFFGQSQSLKVYEDDAVLRDEHISISPLIIVADQRFWGETAYREDEISFDEKKDNVQPLYVAASVERGAVDDPRLRIKSSRMVVVANSNILDATPQRIGQNHSFFMSAINWMLDREELIGIPPKLPSDYSLNLSPKQSSRIKLIVLVLMPATAFLLAFFVWSVRRQ